MSVNTLILIPTRQEREHPEMSHALDSICENESEIVCEICGFGPVESAVGCGLHLERHQPKRVILAGVAGSLHDQAAVGKAYCFESVVMQGIGLHGQHGLNEAAETPFAQSSAWLDCQTRGLLSLQSCNSTCCEKPLQTLVTVCCTAEDPKAAESRSRKFDSASAEDMEGYAVALSCAARKTPLIILRGISNVAGQHDHLQWRMDEAIAAVAKLTQNVVAVPDWDRLSGNEV